jgi:hypothetical protein
MSELRCKRCNEPTEPPGYSVPFIAMPILFILGGISGPFARTGYCSDCAGFGTLVAVLVCAVLVVGAVIVRVAMS